MEAQDVVAGELEALLQGVGCPAGSGAVVLRGDRLAGQRLSAEPQLALLHFDPLAIQDLVLSSRRLVSIHGASMLLDRWDRQLRERRLADSGWITLFAGGGQAVLLGPREYVAVEKRKLIGKFEGELGGLAGVAVREVSPRELAAGPRPLERAVPELEALGIRAGGQAEDGFGALIGHLALKLRVEKDGQSCWAIPAHEGQRCEECGVHAGVEKARWPGCQGHVCARCASFHDQGGAARGGDRPPTLEKLKGGPAYLAFDGARVGARLQQLRTLEEYLAFSGALSAAFGADALGQHMAALGYAPEQYVPVVAGGDDLLLIAGSAETGKGAGPAGSPIIGPIELALALLARIQQTFDAELDRLWPGSPPEELRIGAGAGVVTGKHLPARLGSELARKLTASAKTVLRSGEENRSGLDFELLGPGSPVGGDIDQLRRSKRQRWSPLVSGAKQAWFCCEARPYLSGKAARLAALARDLLQERQVAGRGALYRIRLVMAEDPMAGLVSASYLLSRLPPDVKARKLALPASWVGSSLDSITGLLLEEEQLDDEPEARVWRSVIADLVDLVTLVKQARQA